MAKLLLQFEGRTLREFPLGAEPVTIGRALDNTIQIDNLAVSSFHARVQFHEDRLVLEDLDSLNGTFVNGQRVRRATLRHGDSIQIGKHALLLDEAGADQRPAPLDAGHRASAPQVDETIVLDTKDRREMLQQIAATGERSQLAPGRVRVPTLVVLDGRTDQREYVLSSYLTVIGKSALATVKLRGWFKPKVAAQINRRDDGYYIGRGDQVPSVNGRPIFGPTKLNEGDLIEVGSVKLSFIYRD